MHLLSPLFLPNHRASRTLKFDIRFLFAYALALRRKAPRYELTHFSIERGTDSGSESLGLAQPRLDCLLWLPRNASALALLPATATLRREADSLPGRRKPDQPAPPGAFRERTLC